MKKRILLLVIITGFCSLSMQAQETKPNPCDSIKAIYDQALVMLDSLFAIQIEITRQLDSTGIEVAKSKTQINNLQKEKNEIITILTDARKLISGQTNKIKELEAEVKRLSGSKPPDKKGT